MSINFSCQDKTPELCAESRKILAETNITIIGVGALGSGTSEALIRAGAEKITLIDYDKIEEKNLPRQILYNEEDVGKKKVIIAKEKLNKINNNAKITIKEEKLTKENANELLTGSEIIIDCTDNLETRMIIDEWCQKNKKPWVHAAAIRVFGEAMVIIPGKTISYKELMKGKKETPGCGEEGIIITAAMMTSALQSSLAIRTITGTIKGDEGKLFRINAWKGTINAYKIKKQ